MPIEIWLCDLCYTQQGVSAEVMPAAIGGIATFCETHIKQGLSIRLFKYPEKLIDAMAEGHPHIIGFSNYCWNKNLSYCFAEVINYKYPDIVIVMGGPNYPLDQENQKVFLQNHKVIDFYIYREGELPFTKLLEALIDNEFDIPRVKDLRLNNIHSICEEELFIGGDVLNRICDLSLIPSPYLAGKMDDFFDGKLMPIIQTNRGCPFQCTYCNEGNKYFNAVYSSHRKKIEDEIDYIGRKMAKARLGGGRNDLFIADDNYGMFKGDLDTCRSLAKTRNKYNWPEYIIVATGKNKKERVIEAARIVGGAIRLTGSVQSTDPVVLKNIKRSNVDSRQLIELAEESNKIGANSHAEIILGLPGDSIKKHFESIKVLIDAGFSEVRMYQLMILTGAELSYSGVKEQFGIKTRYRVIPRSFGNYRVDDEINIISAEIEEIVTSLNNLSFQDYLNCRKFNLMVTIFYNDGIFLGLLKLLRYLNISRFEWIYMIYNYPFVADLSEVIKNFLIETEEELWDSRSELVAYTKLPINISKYIREELGSNLLLKYKALVFNNYLNDLAKIAGITILKLITQKGKMTDIVKEIIKDIITYEVMSKEGLWKGDYEARQAIFKYDVKRFIESLDEVSLSKLILPKPKEYQFILTEDQIGMIERSLNAYGRSLTGIARIFSRVHIKSLNRQVLSLQLDN